MRNDEPGMYSANGRSQLVRRRSAEVSANQGDCHMNFNVIKSTKIKVFSVVEIRLTRKIDEEVLQDILNR